MENTKKLPMKNRKIVRNTCKRKKTSGRLNTSLYINEKLMKKIPSLRRKYGDL